MNYNNPPFGRLILEQSYQRWTEMQENYAQNQKFPHNYTFSAKQKNLFEVNQLRNLFNSTGRISNNGDGEVEHPRGQIFENNLEYELGHRHPDMLKQEWSKP
jgi:hypothetical protein